MGEKIVTNNKSAKRMECEGPKVFLKLGCIKEKIGKEGPKKTVNLKVKLYRFLFGNAFFFQLT